MLDPLLLWGITFRLIAFWYFWATFQLLWQVVPLCGSRGVFPLREKLAAASKDFPGWRRYGYFPTVFWIVGASDLALRGGVLLGSLAGAVACVGTPCGSAFFLGVAHVCYVSLAHGVQGWFPWEDLLLESGLLCLFLPPPRWLDLRLAHLPSPMVAFMFRWLLFRLMIGFGMMKFRGSSWKDSLYLKSFFVSIPNMNPISWYCHHAPHSLLRLALVGMFIVELPVPCAVLFGHGVVRSVCGAALVLFQVAIFFTGNFGWFNLLTATLCLPLLDVTSATENAQSSAPALLLLGALFVYSVPMLLGNTWIARSFPFWPTLAWVPSVRIYRLLAPFRLVSPYGVFPPSPAPPGRFVPVFEGYTEELGWREYEYKYQAGCAPDGRTITPPRFCAPYHPRLDFLVFYCYYFPSCLLHPILDSDPYANALYPMLHRVAWRLLDERSPVVDLFARNPFEGSSPQAVRVRMYYLTAVSMEEHLRTGKWWNREVVGLYSHVMTRELNSATRAVAARLEDPFHRWLPEPEDFHVDMSVWMDRCPKITQMRQEMPGVLRGVLARLNEHPSSDSVIPKSEGCVSEEHLLLLWHTLAPFIELHNPGPSLSWEEHLVLATDTAAISPVLADNLGELRKAVNQLCIGMMFRLRSHCQFVHLGAAGSSQKLRVNNTFWLALLCRLIVAGGPQLCAKVLCHGSTADVPQEVVALCGLLNEPEGYCKALFWFAFFCHPTLVHEAKRARLQEAYCVGFRPHPYITGFADFQSMLRQIVFGKDDPGDLLPQFKFDGEEWVLESFKLHTI